MSLLTDWALGTVTVQLDLNKDNKCQYELYIGNRKSE